MNKGIGIALTLTCTSCAPVSAGQDYFVRATPLCTIVADEQKYAGQPVLVSGLLQQTPHGRFLEGPECQRFADLDGSSDTWDRHAKRVIDAALANDKRAEVPVVVGGVFQPSSRYENGARIIRSGGPVIEDATVIAARRP